MTSKEIILEYENILLKKKNNFSNTVLTKNDVASSRKNALVILRYAFEEILHWSPNDIINMLTKNVAEQLRLDSPLKYIEVPVEVNRTIKNRYIAHLIYPRKISFSEREITVDIYKKVLSKRIYGFPKRFLSDDKGMERARACLNHLLQNHLQFHSIEETYSFFASLEGSKALKKYQLFVVSNDLFDTHIDFLHESIPEYQQNDFLFNYYKFRILYARSKRLGGNGDTVS